MSAKPDDVPAAKRALRRAMRERAREAAASPAAPPSPPLAAGGGDPALDIPTAPAAAAREALRAWLDAQRRGTALLYAALPDEAPTRWLDAELRERGWRVAYPRIASLDPPALEARLTLALDDLVPGAFDIPEPPRSICPLVDPASLALVVVPGRAFDLEGRRLGGGLGFYDRFLPACSAARWIGFACPWQVVERVPTEPHDVVLHALAADALHWLR